MKANGYGNAKGRRMQEGMTLSFNDAAQDGMVSMDAFLEGSDRWLAMIDRQKDGVAAADELGAKND
ncbi:MAG: hypothetical protein WBB25_05585 [Sulfitobacter sp.]